MPRWHAENKCYSCHNNGDAARALYTAFRQGYPIPAKALADTTTWLSQPKRWDQNGGEQAYSDKGLARIQFAAALGEAFDAGQVKDRQVLRQAAELVAEGQRKDGSWQGDASENLGTPATHGTGLATYFARRTLQKADPERHRTAIDRATRWFEQMPIRTLLDAAAALLALEGNNTVAAGEQCRKALSLIRKGEAKEGGWGPYANSAPEPFDTAVVLLALQGRSVSANDKKMLERGRDYLVSAQLADGSWKETTRPAGAESYAQRLSTAGWATLALLATRDLSPPVKPAEKK